LRFFKPSISETRPTAITQYKGSSSSCGSSGLADQLTIQQHFTTEYETAKIEREMQQRKYQIHLVL
jgi:Fe-S cluster biogenesis protein NfuA